MDLSAVSKPTARTYSTDPTTRIVNLRARLELERVMRRSDAADPFTLMSRKLDDVLDTLDRLEEMTAAAMYRAAYEAGLAE